MVTRSSIRQYLAVVCMSVGAVGCASQEGLSDRFNTVQENTEVLEMRLTNFEERLALVEQEVGVLRSRGALPEGARWVDPSPSLAKAGGKGQAKGVAAPMEASGAQSAFSPVQAASSAHVPGPASPASPVPSPRPAPTADPGPTAPLAAASVPESSGPLSGHDSASASGSASGSAISQFIGQYEPAGTSGHVGNDSMPSLAPLPRGGEGKGMGGRVVPPVAGSPVAKVPPPASSQVGQGASASSAGLKGLPAGFRTGVRAYDEALAMYYRHEYGRALTAFNSFITEVEGNTKHRGRKLLPNAFYWQGESAYSQGDYLGAILSFKSITSRFPKHAKAPDALLKIGMSYERLKDTDNARFYWQVLIDDFPKSSAARVARGKMAR